MDGTVLPPDLVDARRTPLFDVESVPAALLGSHHATVWAELRVEAGAVRFIELEGPSPRDLRVGAGGRAIIVPGVHHRVEPSDDATFYVQFFREA